MLGRQVRTLGTEETFSMNPGAMTDTLVIKYQVKPNMSCYNTDITYSENFYTLLHSFVSIFHSSVMTLRCITK